MDRKAFIYNSIRITLAGSILALTGFLFRYREVKHGQACSIGSACMNCPELKGCTREEAEKFRKNGGR